MKVGFSSCGKICSLLAACGHPRRDNLREYFEKHYRNGGEFSHPDYEEVPDAALFAWMHWPTGIQVWRDAIDLTSGEGGEVYFHYTSELAFRNITAGEKKAAEVWASLNSDPGPKQNAWWGKGVYSVPLPPDQWRDREQLLDNNFRNMMARDRAAPDKGPEYVEAEYPKRVAFCVPIIIDPPNAYDVSVRATPEMEAAGKEPGRNLGDKLLNEPGMPPRCCVVLRVKGEDGAARQHQTKVKHAQGQLLDALRRRAGSSGDFVAKERLGLVLMDRGLYAEALPVLQEVLEISEAKHGPKSPKTLGSINNLALLLQQMGRYGEALELQRRDLEGTEAMFGPEHRSTLISMNNVAEALRRMGKYGEAMDLQRTALEVQERTLGAEHPEVLGSMNNIANTLVDMGSFAEAAELHRKVLEILRRTLGDEHPETLQSLSNLGVALYNMGRYDEAAEIYGNVLKIMKRTLGEQHPSTLVSMSNLAEALDQLGNHSEAVELLETTLEIMEKTIGSKHPYTVFTISVLGTALRNMGCKP